MKVQNIVRLDTTIKMYKVHEMCRWFCTVNIMQSESIHFELTCEYYQHISDIVSIHFLRTSTLMFSHSFCKSIQRLSFECIAVLSNRVPAQPLQSGNISKKYFNGQVSNNLIRHNTLILINISILILLFTLAYVCLLLVFGVCGGTLISTSAASNSNFLFIL